MKSTNDLKEKALSQDKDKSESDVNQELKKAKDDPSVKQAIQKEKQPVNPGDLSPLHNTREIGTSGGDQREKEIEPGDAQKQNQEKSGE